MSSLAEITASVERSQDLDSPSASAAARSLTDPLVSPSEKEAFLVALHTKGETVEEVTAFAEVFRGLARDPGLGAHAAHAIDVVGTGGSGSRGFNISSCAAIVLAACGVTVLKHGNRAITSQSGSADFLGTLGLPIQDNCDILRQSVEELNFCFFFAPAFHPAFKEIMPVRKALAAKKQRTIFNILGPLINPAKPKYQLLGVFSRDWVPPLAQVMTSLGLDRGLAVHSTISESIRMDELTTAGENRVAGIGELAHMDTTWEANRFGIETCSVESIQGGTPEENVKRFEQMLDGAEKGGLLDTIALNAAAGLYIVSAVSDIQTGVSRAKDALLGGEVKRWLRQAREFYRELN